MKALSIVLILAVYVTAATTSVRIYHQSQATLSSLQNKQIGVNTSADANLGFKMWGGKDADGNVTQWLAKDKNARVLSLRQDSSFSLRDTSKLYKGDSAFITGLNVTRFTTDSCYSSGGASFNRMAIDSITAINKLILATGDSIFITAIKNTRLHADSIAASGGVNLNRVNIDSAIAINRIVVATGDSMNVDAIKNARFYYGVQSGTTVTADSIRVLKFRIGGTTGTVIDTLKIIDGDEDTICITVGAKTWKILPVANQ